MERSNIIDNETIKLAAEGDKAAFDAIYRTYRDKIYYFLVKLGAKPQDAEDLVSETFLEAMKHIQDLKNESGMSAWLHTIAKNKFYAMGRKESRHQRVELLGDDEEDNANDGLELAMQHSAEINDDMIMLPEDYAESEETKDILAEMINSLNESQREAVYLFYHRDKTLEQISQLTGASVNTVKSRIHQAKNHLRKMIGELQSKGVVLCAAPVSAMFRAVDDRIKVRTDHIAPRVFSTFSSKAIAAACALVVGGTGLAIMHGMKKGQPVIDRDSMDNRPEYSRTETDSSRTDEKSVTKKDVPEKVISDSSEDETADEVTLTENVRDDTSQNTAYLPQQTVPANTAVRGQGGNNNNTGNAAVTAVAQQPDILSFGSGNEAFSAKAGDVVMYDIAYNNRADTNSIQFGFDIPEGYEYVGFVPNRQTLRLNVGFDDFGCTFNTEENKEIFDKKNDVTFVGYDSTVTNYSTVDTEGLVIGSVLLRVKDGANENNTKITMDELICNVTKDGDILTDDKLDVKLKPVSVAGESDLKAAKDEETYTLLRDQMMQEEIMAAYGDMDTFMDTSEEGSLDMYDESEYDELPTDLEYLLY